MSQQADNRTPTETLMRCLEDFGRDEPKTALVVYVTDGGDICWSTSAPMSRVQLLGMLRYIQVLEEDKIREDRASE